LAQSSDYVIAEGNLLIAEDKARIVVAGAVSTAPSAASRLRRFMATYTGLTAEGAVLTGVLPDTPALSVFLIRNQMGEYFQSPSLKINFPTRNFNAQNSHQQAPHPNPPIKNVDILPFFVLLFTLPLGNISNYHPELAEGTYFECYPESSAMSSS